MPFYEYECRACGEQTEVLQKISDKPLRKCPSCGKSALVKLVSAPIFRLKGSGWYETDFKSDQDKKRNLADGKAVDKTDDKAEAKTEAKGDAKSETKSESKSDTKSEAQSSGAKSSGAKSSGAKSKGKSSRSAKPARSAAPRKAK